jgi:hypothetical protein
MRLTMKLQTMGLTMLMFSLLGGTTMLVMNEPETALVVWLLGGVPAIVLVIAGTLRRHSQK